LNVMPEVLVTGGGNAFEGLAASLMRGMNGKPEAKVAAGLRPPRESRKKLKGTDH